MKLLFNHTIINHIYHNNILVGYIIEIDNGDTQYLTINDYLNFLNESSKYNLLKKWWDFMDNDCTAKRNEYTDKEQNELIEKFLLYLNESSPTNTDRCL